MTALGYPLQWGHLWRDAAVGARMPVRHRLAGPGPPGDAHNDRSPQPPGSPIRALGPALVLVPPSPAYPGAVTLAKQMWQFFRFPSGLAQAHRGRPVTPE